MDDLVEGENLMIGDKGKLLEQHLLVVQRGWDQLQR